MGQTKGRRNRRRRFGQACGKQSKKYRTSEFNKQIRQEQRNKLLNSDKHFFRPYSIVKKPIFKEGKPSTKITVRRIHVSLDKKKKLLRLGENSLKFKMHLCNQDLSGYRIINLEMLKRHITEITSHCCMCSSAHDIVAQGKDPIVLKCEVRRNGLFSIIDVRCKGCGFECPLETSVKHSNGLYDINVRAVWGTAASGCGPSDLNEILTTMDVPPMNENMFTKLEQQIGDWWHECLKEEMMKAASEEKRIAIEKESYHQGIPAITVICDGGWSKRTHKHTYNAAGGVAVIFGAETNKLLYIGVRNKYCVICRRAENANIEAKPHKCYANWTESSQAMESDIILQGFLSAESSYGLRYMKLIADGDSSVYSTLQEQVPVWGKDIIKLECANHVCKCLRSNLEKLVVEKPQYKGKGKLTKINRIRLTTAVRCAIKMRSKTNDAKQLKRDILNSIYHILGFHAQCSDFCQKRKITSTETNFDNEEEDNESFDQLFEKQQDYWKIPSDEEILSSRAAEINNVPLVELKELISDVEIILNRLAEKSSRLIGNFTTNLAESWMAIRAKFDGGKVVNRCSRGSWETRCYGGALRKNLGSAWSPLAFQTITSTKAGVHFHQGAKIQLRKLAQSNKYKSKPENKKKRQKRKLTNSAQNVTKKAKRSYGSNLDDTPDIDPAKLQELCSKFLDNNFHKSKEEMDIIERSTIDQSRSEMWKRERRIRLTSSNFGKVIKRRATNISTALVKNMLYPTFQGNLFTIKGLSEESNTIIEYKNVKGNVEVEKAGFKVHKEHQFLGASGDGIVVEGKEKGLLEIKNFLQNNTYLISEAIEKVPNFCLEKQGEKVCLKKTHGIYYQIQGQINIYGVEWCDFVLRRTKPHDMHIERIYRDDPLWINTMQPKLECFFHKFILPELAHPRHGTYTGIREPTSPWIDEQGCHSRATKKQKKSTSGEATNSILSLQAPSTSQTRHIETEVSTRSRRQRTVKFVGRDIKHEWVIDENTGETKWFKGLVTDVLQGKDGAHNAVYEVQYVGEDSPYEVDHLLIDYRKGSVKFMDL